MQVVIAEVKQQSVAEKISLVGNLLPNESVEVKSEIEGTVLEINFQEGHPVEKGQLLIRLDERKLTATVSEAEANFKLTETNLERARHLFRDKLISKEEFDRATSTHQAQEAGLELKRQQLRDARITAPFAGIAGARSVSPGQVISLNTVLTWISDLDPIKVEVNVPERFLAQLKTGQKIELTVASRPGKKYAGEVYFISSQVDTATRTALVKATVPNESGELKSGMFASLDLTLNVRDKAIVIPESALSRVMTQDRAMVFVVDHADAAQLRPVKLGLRLAGQVEIVEGLSPGERVVVEGVQKLGPGAKVKTAQAAPAPTVPPTNAPAQAPKA
jgi:membrane fusion protein (multidrug efflux system)